MANSTSGAQAWRILDRHCDDNLTLLTRSNAQEIIKLDRLGCFQPLAEWLASFPARRLSRQILRFDDLVGQHGLAAVGRYILDELQGLGGRPAPWP